MDPLSLGLTLGLSGLASSYIQSRAARQASEAQAGMSQEAIAEQRRQFDEIRTLLSPFVQAGYTAMERLPGYITAGERAFEQQAALAGLSGPEAQRAALEGISTSPGFQEAVRQGERAILANASATGRLGGGQMAAVLAQFRPQMLQQAIEQTYGRLGGLAGTGLGLTENLITRGQNAAGTTAQAGQQTGANIGNLLTQQGQAMAGGILGQAAPFAQFAALPGQIAGVGLARGLFGGTQPTGASGTIAGGSGIRLPRV
jgi:hypothetical protein